MDYKYSILTASFGGYEPNREPEFDDPDVEMVLVTDIPGLRSDRWSVVHLMNGETFMDVKHDPFKYVSSPVVVWVDGSYQLKAAPDQLVVDFLNSGKDFAVSLHERRHNAYEEILAWMVYRGASVANAKALAFNMLQAGFNSTLLVQTSVYVAKNTSRVAQMFIDTIRLGRMASVDGMYRDDQAVMSAVLEAGGWDESSIMLMDFEATQHNMYWDWCAHGSDRHYTLECTNRVAFGRWQDDLYRIGG